MLHNAPVLPSFVWLFGFPELCLALNLAVRCVAALYLFPQGLIVFIIEWEYMFYKEVWLSPGLSSFVRRGDGSHPLRRDGELDG